jgi:ABC-2 type transport system ATP-binding protein
MLELVNYQKSFGSREVLNIPYLKLQKGTYWLKGENGVGKSTLLKSIAGISGFKGSILLNGCDSAKSPVQYRKAVNYGEAEPLFPDFLTGSDLVQLFSETKLADPDKTQNLLQQLRIDYLGDPVSTYSSGMLKKLSLVLAFLGQPELIILDEPLITLDTESIKTVLSWINESQNTTFLITSHQEIPESICTSQLLINEKTVHTL